MRRTTTANPAAAAATESEECSGSNGDRIAVATPTTDANNNNNNNNNPLLADVDFQQLAILVAGLICMGAALGFERSLLPRMAVEVWHVTSSTTILNLVSTFGASKAMANVFAGPLADQFGRKPTLILGFLLGLPVMPFVNYADSWTEVTVMNILFGVSQGLLGSSLFFLLIDVLGPHRRGIAVGMGECTIYVSTALLNVVAGDLASRFGYRPVPFWVATVFAIAGLLSTGPLRDTLDQVRAEQETTDQQLTLTKTVTVKDKTKEQLISAEYRHRQALSSSDDLSNNDNSSSDTTDIEAKSPNDVKKWHRVQVPIEGDEENRVDDEENIAADNDTQLWTTPTYQDYEEADSDMDESDDEDNKSVEYWDRLERNVKNIPMAALRSLGHVPGSVYQCATGSECRPLMSNASRADTTSSMASQNQAAYPYYEDEQSPLVRKSYEVYNSRSDSDLESGDDTEVDWDEVEKEVKTLYPSAVYVLATIIWNNPNFNVLCLAGMAMNFKDGFAWGSFPIFFSQFHNLSDDHTDMLVAIYPLCWGFAQAFTGALSDVYGRKLFLQAGFAACTIATTLFFVPGFIWGRPADDNPLHIHVWIVADVLLGLGTAMAYPALQAAVADEMEPVNRGLGLGFYRFVRDMGYVVGALVCGSLTDVLGYPMTFLIVSAVLGASLLSVCLCYKSRPRVPA